MAVSIGPTIGIKGEREFRASLKEIIAETQSYRAEIDKLSASFSKNDDALTRNQKVQEKLNSQISVQEKVVQDNINIHEKAAQKYSEQTMLVEAYKNTVASEQQMLDSMGKKLEALRAQYGDNNAIVQGATETYAQLRKQLTDDSKAYENLKVDVHRSGQTMQEWKVKVTQSEVELENLRKELAKAPNYVEEFNRKTVENTRNLQKYENQVSQLDSEMKKTESSYDRFTSAIKRASDATENIRQKISAEAGVLVENRRLKNEAIQTEEKQRKAYEELLKKLADAERQYGKDSEQVRILNDAVDEQARLVHEASMKTAEYTQKVTETETAINNLNNELSDNSALKAWGETFDGVGEKMEQFGDIMTKYVTTPLMALGTYSVKAASDFEDGMAKIYTIAIDGAEPMEKMRQELVELSNQTGFSLEDLTEATYQAVSASVDSTKAVDFMTDATKLARAGFTTTTKAVDLLTTVINAYGMKAEDAAKISDILLKTQNDGKTVIDELASSMGIIIPMASNYGVGLDQIAAAYATMTKQGVKTEKATTFLRAVFTELEKESSDVAKILDKKTGKSFAQLMKEGNNLSDVLGILYKEAHGNTEEFQRLFGNVRATQAVASLVAEGVGEDAHQFGMFEYELRRVRDSAGQVNKALEVMETPSLKARRAVNKLKNTAVDLGDSMLEMVMPSFEKATDKVTELTDAFVKLQPESKEIIIRNGLLAASVGPVIKVGGKLIKYVGALLTGTGSFIPLIALATGGLIAMATAVQVAAKEQDLLREKQYGLSEEAKTAIARIDELKQAHQDFKVSMQGETTEVMNNVAYVQELVRQYDNLCTETGEVKEGNEQLAEVLKGEIAEALGISYDDLQLLIDQNGKLSSAIGGTVEAYKKQALAAVYQQQLTEATQRLVEHQMLDKQLTEQQSQALEKFNTTMREAVDAKRAIKEAEEKSLPVTDEMYKRYNEATLNYSEAKNALDTVSQAIRDNKAEMKNAQSEIDFYGNKIAETGDKAEESAEKVEQSGEKIVQSAEETAEGVKEAMNIDADDTAYNFMLGFANGITKYRHLATEAASIAGKRALDALNGSVEVSSPSKLTYQTGRYFVEGFANALDEGMPMMNRIAQRLGTSASNGLAFGSYLPDTGSVVNNTKSISAPISINMTVNGNVDDPDGLTNMIADKLVSMINGERSVFA